MNTRERGLRGLGEEFTAVFAGVGGYGMHVALVEEEPPIVHGWDVGMVWGKPQGDCGNNTMRARSVRALRGVEFDGPGLFEAAGLTLLDQPFEHVVYAGGPGGLVTRLV